MYPLHKTFWRFCQSRILPGNVNMNVSPNFRKRNTFWTTRLHVLGGSTYGVSKTNAVQLDILQSYIETNELIIELVSSRVLSNMWNGNSSEVVMWAPKVGSINMNE